MAAALALARRGRGRTGANPNVGSLLVKLVLLAVVVFLHELPDGIATHVVVEEAV